MIKSLGGQVGAALDATQLRASGKTRAADLLSSGATPETSGATATPAARMAALGAPIDSDRVAEIRVAIASGNYPIDPARIADRMLALDLPLR
jgi:negative regulator of flagellin synthesis FlgM